MNFIRCIVILCVLGVVRAIAQPFPPVLRNAMTTNVAGTAVKSVNNLFVTNFSGGLTHTQWNFFGRSPDTIARLVDISNVVNSVSGSATNAISTIQSNGVNVSSMATNLNFVDSPTVLVLMTNSPSGHIHVSFQATGSAGGETNWLGDAGTTNATRIGLADGKSNNTNLVKTLMGGNGIILTNNIGGTNVMIAIDPAVIATQSNLNAASNFLYSVRGESNWVADAFGTNSTRFGWFYVKENGTNYLKTFSAGFGMSFTNQGSNVVFAVDNTVIASQVNLNAASNVLRTDIGNLQGSTNFNQTNIVSLSTTNATSKPLTNSYVNGLLVLRGIEAGANISITANPSNYVIAGTGGSGSLAVQTNSVNLGQETNLNLIAGTGILINATNVSGTNQVGFAVDPVLENLIGTVANNVTNVVSLSTSNALSKPITNLYQNGTLTLRGVEAGANITITANPSNYVIASSGGGGSGSLAVQTNRVNLGTETNLNFVTGNAISIFSTNMSGTNDIQFSVTAYIDVTSPPYSAVGDGITDDTAAFQNACTNQGANIMVPYRIAGYLVSNIYISNSVTLFGVGGQSRLIFNPASTGYMLSSTNNSGITVRNLELDGTNDISWKSVSSGGGRSGISLFAYGGNNKILNCYIHGFDANGILVTSTNTSTSTTATLTSNNVSVSHCDVRRCFVGIQIDENRAEYIKVADCRVWECNVGFKTGSASTLFTGCEAFLNNTGFEVYGAINDGHGSIVGCIINHNNNPLMFSTVNTGFIVSGCQIWEGTNFIDTCSGVQITDCMGSITRWQCTSATGDNWVRNNIWFTTYGNTVFHGAGDRTIFSANTDPVGNVIGDQGFYAKSNVVFQGNSSFTNASGTNYVVGSQHVNRSIISNSLALLNFGPSVGAVWTCTNATTGEGRWSTNQGQIFLSVQSGLIPVPPSPSLDQGTNQTWRLLFDDATNEVIYYQFPLPDNYYTNAQIMFHYSTLAAAANTSNVWDVAVMVVPGMGGKTINADSYNGSVSVTQQVNSTAGFLNTAMLSCNATSAIAGDLLKLKLTRKGTNLFDNAAGDAALHSIVFEYDKKAQ